jgi:2-oxoglutarate ferredoxin oxidoreductase subunit gamma
MLERLLVAGSGGQGVILVGKLLATVAVRTVPFVTFFPAYGAEVRGGTSHCQVMLSSNEIASPEAKEFDSMLIMNQASADAFALQLADGGVYVMNSSLCRGDAPPSTVAVRATDLADELGDTRVANFIMLGALMARKQPVGVKDVEAGIADMLAGKGQDLVDLNIEAFRTGLQQGTET